MTAAIDIDDLRQWIGREETASETVTDALLDRFRATFNLGGASGSTAAPTLVHLCIAPPAAPTADLGADGHPARGGFLPPVPLPRRMWAGGRFNFIDDIRAGDDVTRHSRIRDVVIKQGRTGPLCFVTVDHRIFSNDRLAVEERQDIVYRANDADAAPADTGRPAEAPAGQSQVLVDPSPVLLFRYSALSFNGHRIHYDAPYARTEESYPGLIVHGPMQATMLVQLAERLRGTRPSSFQFRSLSPLFDTGPFTLNAQDDGIGLRLWTASPNGPVAMEASASW